YRTRATLAAPREGRFVNPLSSRAITIQPGRPTDAKPRPISYAAPFVAAEQPGELAEEPELLPDFTPTRPPTADELADRMWKPEPPEVEEPTVRSLWNGRAEPVRLPEPSASPARDRLAESTLETVCGRLPRALLMTSSQDGIVGWTARGSGLTRDQIQSVRIPWGEPSIFAFIKLSGSPHKGPLSKILVPPKLAALLGDKAAASCAVFPVRIKDRLVAFLYADRLGAPLSDEDYRSLEIAASALGSSLARLLLELRRALPA